MITAQRYPNIIVFHEKGSGMWHALGIGEVRTGLWVGGET